MFCKIIFGIGVVIIFAAVIDEMIHGIRNMKLRNELRETIAKGDRYIHRYYIHPDNPFHNYTPWDVEVLDVKRNDKNEVWVKYHWVREREWTKEEDVYETPFEIFYEKYKKYND